MRNARRLVERGVFVTVLTTDRTGTLPAHEEKDGVQVLRVPAWPRGRDYFFAPDVYRIVARNSWDVVHRPGRLWEIMSTTAVTLNYMFWLRRLRKGIHRDPRKAEYTDPAMTLPEAAPQRTAVAAAA